MKAKSNHQNRRVLGVETEYGAAHQVETTGKASSRDQVLTHLMSLVPQHHACLPSGDGPGQFLANGARLYVDRGGHPEFCTPEVETPWEAVRYVRAGDELLYHLARELPGPPDGPGLRLFRCNVDYSGSGATWACHENYSHRANVERLLRNLIALLCSRICFTGAGGMDPLSPGIRFCLSPRVFRLEGVYTQDSTERRGIVHDKDEDLSRDGSSRLHLLCGESLCSQRASVLKLGSTALVVALVEAGIEPGEEVQLAAPLEAMQAFNLDPSCRVTAKMADGTHRTALEIQQHYLAVARRHLDHPCMPDWAGRICQLWGETLEHLEQGSAALSRELDWAIKRTLYRSHLDSLGVSEEQLRRWNQLAPQRRPPRPRDQARILHRLMEEPAQDLAEDRPHPQWDGLPQADKQLLQRARAELAELEIRFSQLGPDSLFDVLDRNGLLDHRLPEISPESVTAAVRNPPDSGRARVRGLEIQRLSGRPECRCDWSGIVDDGGQFLDLADPLARTEPVWAKAPSPRPQRSRLLRRQTQVDEQYVWGKRLYERGRYQDAYEFLTERLRAWAPAPAPTELAELLAWVQYRRGACTEAQTLLQQRADSESLSFSLVNEFVALYRFGGLVPDDNVREWIRVGDGLLARDLGGDHSASFAFFGHKGCAMMHLGELCQAQAILERALAGEPERRNTSPRLYARVLADLGEVHRRKHEQAEAQRCLDEAEFLQRQGGFIGDLMDITFAARARLSPRWAGDWRTLLNEAQCTQRETSNWMGLARSLLLEARLREYSSSRAGRMRRELLSLQEQTPALQRCPRLAKVLNHWTPWCRGAQPDDETDGFWGI